MANTKSAKKMIRKIAAKTEINRNRRNRVRTFIKSVESLITDNKKEEARQALRVAEGEMSRAVSKGVFHKNTCARKIFPFEYTHQGFVSIACLFEGG